MRPQKKHYFQRHFRASKMAAFTKTLQKHGLPVQGAQICNSKGILFALQLRAVTVSGYALTVSAIHEVPKIPPRAVTVTSINPGQGQNCNFGFFFPPHLPCEMAEANFWRFQWFSCRFSNDFLSFSISFSQFQSILISFNQFQPI